MGVKAKLPGVTETAWTIVLANLIPLIGVLFYGWDPVEVAFLFWAETIILGVFQVIRLVTTRNMVNQRLIDLTPPENRDSLTPWEDEKPGVQLFFRIFLPVFFIIHYGFFVAIQGNILFGVILEDQLPSMRSGPIGNLIDIARYFCPREHVQTGLLGLLVAYSLHFLQGILWEERHKTDSVLLEFIAPYKRIIIQQVLVIIGTPLVLFTRIPAMLMAVLVLLKSFFDLWAYRSGDEYFWLKGKAAQEDAR
jgi:hypothetical protein